LSQNEGLTAITIELFGAINVLRIGSFFIDVADPVGQWVNAHPEDAVIAEKLARPGSKLASSDEKKGYIPSPLASHSHRPHMECSSFLFEDHLSGDELKAALDSGAAKRGCFRVDRDYFGEAYVTLRGTAGPDQRVLIVGTCPISLSLP